MLGLIHRGIIHRFYFGIILREQVTKQVPNRYIGEEQTHPGGEPQQIKKS